MKHYNKKVPEYAKDLLDLEVCCPRCLSIMVLRRGRSGFYFLCSESPKCKGRRSADAARKLSLFEVVVAKCVQSPLSGDAILSNPDAPSFVWYENHDLNLGDEAVASNSQEILEIMEEPEEVATNEV